MRINGIANQNNQSFGKLIIHRNPETLEFFYNLFYCGKNNNTQDTFEKTIELFDRINEETGDIPVHFKADNSSLGSRYVNFELEANGNKHPSYGFLDYGKDDFCRKALGELSNTYKRFAERFNAKEAEKALNDLDEKEIKTVFKRYC